VRPSKGADRPSLLAIQPRNRELSAARRVALLAAFDSLDEDTRADLLEAAETIARRAGVSCVDFEAADIREIITRVYRVAGWE
jgi:hypothetical protein